MLRHCFDRETNTCPITSGCELRRYLRDALQAFVDTLNTHTLSDVLRGNRGVKLAAVFLQIQQKPSPDRLPKT